MHLHTNDQKRINLISLYVPFLAIAYFSLIIANYGFYARTGFMGHAKADLVLSILWLGLTYDYGLKKSIQLMIGALLLHETIFFILISTYTQTFPSLSIAWVEPLASIPVITIMILIRKSFHPDKDALLGIIGFVSINILWIINGFSISVNQFTNQIIDASFTTALFELGYNVSFCIMFYLVFRLK